MLSVLLKIFWFRLVGTVLSTECDFEKSSQVKGLSHFPYTKSVLVTRAMFLSAYVHR